MRIPTLQLYATTDDLIDLSALSGRTVVYAYPRTSVPGVPSPANWAEIPGASGCTPQTLAFERSRTKFSAIGARIFGLSTQTSDYQKELSTRLNLTFSLLSDAEFKLTEALKLPTMIVEGMLLIKRITLVIQDGRIERVFYPVPDPGKSAAEVIHWLEANPATKVL